MDWFPYDNGPRHERVKEVQVWAIKFCRDFPLKISCFEIKEQGKYITKKVFPKLFLQFLILLLIF